jgi:multidrug efflux pump subunit AcrA (membrane-fusion protein)
MFMTRMHGAGWLWLVVVAAVVARSGLAEPGIAPAEPVLTNCLVSLVEEAKVPAREAGVLLELTVREGDTVRAGEMIARIDDNQAQMEKRRAKAEHDQASAKAESDVDIRYSSTKRRWSLIRMCRAA